MASPYSRVPLAEKVFLLSQVAFTSVFTTTFQMKYGYIVFGCFWFQIDELARSHPALLTLKSVDLSPASWMAVSW